MRQTGRERERKRENLVFFFLSVFLGARVFLYVSLLVRTRDSARVHGISVE